MGRPFGRVTASSIAALLASKRSELILVLRVTVASALAFVADRLVGLSQGTWAVITAIIVMQASLGGSVKAAMDRMAGTLVGAIWGAAISLLVPHHGDLETGIAIVVAVAPTALFAALSPSFRVAPITALIVLVPSGGTALSPLAYAFDRVGEILLGIIAGVGVALFVLPARAQNLMLLSAARIAELNADLLAALITALMEGQGRPDVASIHARIRASLKQMDAAVDEAARERKTHLSDHVDPEPVARTLYRVRHDLVIIGRASATELPLAVKPALEDPLLGVRDAAIAMLRGTATALRAATPPPDLAAFDASLAIYVAAMDALRAGGVIRRMESEEVGRIYALRFGFEQLGLDLRDLSERGRELVEKGRPADL
ncbi:FUSC family protein [Labrys monachus]|uniref:Membrane protein YccC n=1 Tax=Labrys monachus TaxID=217067 RepID=A0ABU0F6P1_9HYPH|nr:FUSC family protein [Labrys monachus]MDQ0390216.1 putative membrane protein YccC [Labrys monachus]